MRALSSDRGHFPNTDRVLSVRQYIIGELNIYSYVSLNNVAISLAQLVKTLTINLDLAGLRLVSVIYFFSCKLSFFKSYLPYYLYASRKFFF